MKRILLILAALVLAGFAVAGPARAEEDAMSDEALMQMAKEKENQGMPEEARKVLDGIVGKWDYAVTFRSAPDAPEQTSIGTTENRWVLNGQFVQQNVTGTMDIGDETRKFSGVGYIGHDNINGEYRTIWLDNRGAESMISRGAYDPATKTIKEIGATSCTMKEGTVRFESELTFTDPDHFTFTMYEDAGERFRSMEIRYTRKK